MASAWQPEFQDALVPSASPPMKVRKSSDASEAIRLENLSKLTKVPFDYLSKVQREEVDSRCYRSAVSMMLSCSQAYGLDLSTFQQAMTTLDSFLSCTRIQVKHVYIVAMSCLAIASRNCSSKEIPLDYIVIHCQERFTAGDLSRMIAIVSQKTPPSSNVDGGVSLYDAIEAVVNAIDWAILPSSSPERKKLLPAIPEDEEVFFNNIEKARVWRHVCSLFKKVIKDYSLSKKLDTLGLAFAIVAVATEPLYRHRRGVKAVVDLRDSIQFSGVEFERCVWKLSASLDLNFPLSCF